MSNHLPPLAVVEALIGRPEKIGAICGVNPKSPYQWRGPAGWRGAGDIPFAAHMRQLLEYSEAKGIGLTATHLIRGADEAEVAAILAARASHSLQAAE